MIHETATAATRACPICEGPASGLSFPYQTVWNEKSYDYRRCRDCGSTFVDPAPAEEDLKAIYAWANYHARHYAEADRSQYGHSLDVLRRNTPGKTTLLDFGCGAGAFLTAAKEAGYDCAGVEYEETAIAMAQASSGVPVMSLDALLETGRRFDIVHMSDVLPHLPDPAAMLRSLETLLAPGGLFFIEGPLENNASLVYYTASMTKTVRRWLGHRAPGVAAPTMLYRVGRQAQRVFFTERMGYKEIHFEVYETGWPYFVAGRPLRAASDWVKQGIGMLAIATSRLPGPTSRRLGNRFMGLVQPTRGL